MPTMGLYCTRDNENEVYGLHESRQATSKCNDKAAVKSMAGNRGQPDLTLPEQKITSLSFCEVNPRAFKTWVEGLPIANVGESARQLYHAIIELNQLEASPQLRMKLLGSLRPQVRFVCDQLAQHFLGRSIALTEKQRKIANLAQALQLHLANGYKLALSQIASQAQESKHRELVTKACHRALSGLSDTVMRASQLYCPSPARSWYEIHQIFRYALEHELTDYLVPDTTNQFRQETSIADAYKRLLLLGCCRPNQLRQKELAVVYQLFECWTDHTELVQVGMSKALFIISLDEDGPPVYRNLMKMPLSNHHLGFDSTRLAEALSHYPEARDSKKLDNDLPEIPASVSDALLMHLSQALGILTKRSFRRMPSSGKLQIAVGMSALHYYCAGETPFNRFANSVEGSSDENIFLSAAQRKNDAWAGAFDADKSESMVSPDMPINFRGASGDIADNEEHQRAYPWYEVSLENTSPGGYCINWDADMPVSLQTGEILGVREHEDHPWSIALIRWIRQAGKRGTQLGVELLAPGATPCALRLDQKVGNSSEFLRGLLLPELNSIGQPATLLTPRMPFQTGNRITLLWEGQQQQAQLSRRVSTTSSISRFELKFRQPTAAPATARGPAGSGEEDDFDSLWHSL